MQCIIFSFNRACQLNTLLDSIRRFVKSITLKIDVVYNSTGGEYEEAYTLLKGLFPEVTFTKEVVSNTSGFLQNKELGYWRNYYNFFKYPARVKGGSFKKNISDILHADKSGLVFFLTDDSIFLSEPTIDPAIVAAIHKDPSQAMFSFRHGLNQADAPKASLFRFENYMHYKVVKTDSPHWTYKFSVDGHVYSRDFIQQLSNKIHYSNPNSFEAFVNTYCVKKDYFNNIYFNPANTLVGFELNRVQSFTENNNLNFSTEKLNRYFIDGFKLKYIHNVVNDFRPVLNSLSFSKNSESFQIKL